MTAALLVASLLYRPCILSAVAWAESRGDWHGALRGYRYGYPGVRGERGQQYAAAVLRRCGGVR